MMTGGDELSLLWPAVALGAALIGLALLFGGLSVILAIWRRTYSPFGWVVQVRWNTGWIVLPALILGAVMVGYVGLAVVALTGGVAAGIVTSLLPMYGAVLAVAVVGTLFGLAVGIARAGINESVYRLVVVPGAVVAGVVVTLLAGVVVWWQGTGADEQVLDFAYGGVGAGVVGLALVVVALVVRRRGRARKDASGE